MGGFIGKIIETGDDAESAGFGESADPCGAHAVFPGFDLRLIERGNAVEAKIVSRGGRVACAVGRGEILCKHIQREFAFEEFAIGEGERGAGDFIHCRPSIRFALTRRGGPTGG